LIKGKRWLLWTRWANLTPDKQQILNQLFKLNRKVMKTYQMAAAASVQSLSENAPRTP